MFDDLDEGEHLVGWLAAGLGLLLTLGVVGGLLVREYAASQRAAAPAAAVAAAAGATTTTPTETGR